VTLVYPTDKLEELVPTIREINQEWTNYVMEGLSEEEIAQFEATLLKIARRAKEYVNSKDEIET
jgi:DNA-binding MarR family transcriptional regulator